MEIPGFASRHNHSFILAFENGLKVSVCWGRNCYCDRYEFGTAPELDLEQEIVTSPNAEIAVSQNRTLMCWGIDTVAGEMTADQVGRVIGIVQAAEDLSEGVLELERLGLGPKSVHTGKLEWVRRKLVEIGLAHEPTKEIDMQVRLDLPHETNDRIA